MKVRTLQENLRKALWKRIDAGEITGLKLADLTGFKQAHISNFLNRKRSLSIEGFDNLLGVAHLSVLDLLDPNEVNKRASILPPSDDEFENVLLVEGEIAAGEPLVTNETVKEILKFKKSFLKRLRPAMVGARSDWRRFVMVKVDATRERRPSIRLAIRGYPTVMLMDGKGNEITRVVGYRDAGDLASELKEAMSKAGVTREDWQYAAEVTNSLTNALMSHGFVTAPASLVPNAWPACKSPSRNWHASQSSNSG